MDIVFFLISDVCNGTVSLFKKKIFQKHTPPSSEMQNLFQRWHLKDIQGEESWIWKIMGFTNKKFAKKFKHFGTFWIILDYFAQL